MKNDQKDPALKMPTPAELGGASVTSQLHELLLHSLKDIYWAENQLIKTLPMLRDQATTAGLKMAIQEHHIQTEKHVQRLEQAFNLLGEKAAGEKCEAMAGLLKETEAILGQTSAGTMTRDAAIIFAAQKVEHYEIATYGGLLEFARTLGLKQVAGLLNATLDEEKQADQGLSLIAQTGINWEAEHEPVAEASDKL
ncbi:MAG: ferritin-like domain-containing protein [Chitinophagaceae bacterium]|nr:MAG: ferritin-like domain-containing protein [Chitinophagaceae bacterium]